MYSLFKCNVSAKFTNLTKKRKIIGKILKIASSESIFVTSIWRHFRTEILAKYYKFIRFFINYYYNICVYHFIVSIYDSIIVCNEIKIGMVIYGEGGVSKFVNVPEFDNFAYFGPIFVGRSPNKFTYNYKIYLYWISDGTPFI